MASPLLTHTIKFNNAIAALFQLNHSESALILLYSFIDRMSWLSVDGDSSGSDFKMWVESYLLPQGEISCTANDLWAARCALLHTGSVEARDTKKGSARKIHYSTGALLMRPETVPDDEVYLNVGILHSNLFGAVSAFESHLDANPEKKALAHQKLNSIISWVKVA